MTKQDLIDWATDILGAIGVVAILSTLWDGTLVLPSDLNARGWAFVGIWLFFFRCIRP